MQIFFRLVIIAICMALISACVTPRAVIESVDKTVKQSDFPPIGEVKTSELGEPLVVQQDVVVMRGRKITQVTRGIYKGAPVDYHGFFYRANNGQYYCGTVVFRLSDRDGAKELTCLTDEEFKEWKLPYEESVETTQAPTNLQKVLEYSGRTGNSISLFYKEFNGTTDGLFIRPAFTQEFKFDLGASSIVGMKGARIEVIKATNTGITYKVISHFPR
jgi:hypothetical protein